MILKERDSMKKFIAPLLILCLLLASPALAEQDLTGRPVADGTVAAASFVDVTAPYSGTLNIALSPPSELSPSVMSPPWLLAMSRAMARPNPVLLLSTLRAWSMR